MPEKIFDSHAHYDDEAFDDDRDELLASFPEAGICGIINCAQDIKTSEYSIKLAEKYDYIWAAVGIYPHETINAGKNDIAKLRKLLRHPKVVAVGEIGLDYHYDDSPRDMQLEWLEKQIILANELDKPIIFHDREAHEDTLNILQKYRPKGVIHCFSGSVETAREILKIGMYIGLGGVVTFKNTRKALEVAKIVPEDRLLIETDAPYMAPVPFRGKRCTSKLIPYSAEKIAEVRGVTTDEILKITRQNAINLFLAK